jgi:hypothetical protein
VPRPAREVADIFRSHGAAWRKANAGHLSLGQLKAMAAIEACRTAELGGHVARCEDCAHTVISYNSCGNRHCPKCQGAAARQWLAEREAELLPLPYYHVVFTLPPAIGAIAWQNKAKVYGLLFKAASEAMLTIAADPRHLGARIGITAVLHTWGSALTHHPHVHMIVPGGGLSLDGQRFVPCRRSFFLPVRVLSRLFPAAGAGKDRCHLWQGASDLAGRTGKTGAGRCIRRPIEAAAPEKLVRLRQAAFCRAKGGARLSLALHAPRRHLEYEAHRP